MYHVVALSGGKDSTAMALRLAELEPRDYMYVCTPTGDEPDEMFAHWNTLKTLLGSPVLPIVDIRGLNGLIQQNRSLPNFRQRWCTRILKIEPYMRWLRLHTPATSYVGLRADEPTRVGGVFFDVPDVIQRYPLREWNWDINDVYTYLQSRNVTIPFRTDCQRCFFQTLYEWYVLWRDKLDVYLDAEAQETFTGHTFRSPQRDTQPTSLVDLRRKFESGYIPKPRGEALRKLQCRACSL